MKINNNLFPFYKQVEWYPNVNDPIYLYHNGSNLKAWVSVTVMCKNVSTIITVINTYMCSFVVMSYSAFVV